jgi:quercetin dioxygenase-like cupin family protein
MSNRRRFWRALMAVALVLALPYLARGATDQPVGRNIAEMKFVAFPGLPTCAPGAVQSGDPTKGSSILVSKVAAGCVIPWHWHTANEHLMIVSGVARVEVKDGKPVTLQAGGFGLMPSHHVHQFRCPTACTLYVYSDAALDIHYVDAQGKEISPDDALKAVREKTVKPMMK